MILDSLLRIRNIYKYLNRVKGKWETKVTKNSKLWTELKRLKIYTDMKNITHPNCYV
jgi:hypothetical protein